MVDRFRLARIVVLSCLASPAVAQVTPPQEYSKYVGKSNSVEAFAGFGEQINLRDGSFEVRSTDVELPGTGPTIRITRTFRPYSLGRDSYNTSGVGLGGWEIEVPRIKTMTSSTLGTSPYSPFGWQVIGSNATEKNARCSRFAAPGRTTFTFDQARAWNAWEWWDGYHLVDDTGNDQLVMTRTSTTVRPDMPLMTGGNWLVGCLPATTSGEPGEAFYALAPDGTKYWFDYLVYTDADDLQKPLWSNTPLILQPDESSVGKKAPKKPPTQNLVGDSDYLERRMAAMFATRVEDRFGNWVTYHYTAGKLDSIDASDGRHVGFAYGPAGTVTLTVGGGVAARTWTYVYGAGGPRAMQQLTVTRPDGSKWQYALPALTAAVLDLPSGPTQGCGLDAYDPGAVQQGTIISPSGATMTLNLASKRFARSYVPKECWGGEPTSPNIGYAKFPNEWIAFALVSRTISGPGLATASWSYAYAPPVPSWEQDCAPPTSCVSTVWTDVTSPDGSRRRSIFSNKYDASEHKLLREEDYTASSVLLRAKDYAYATVNMADWQNNPYPWPARVGNDQQTRVNVQTSGQWAPARQTLITQQGKTFMWQVPFTCGSGGISPCFDGYARPTKTVKATSP